MIINRIIDGVPYAIELGDEELETAYNEVRRRRNREDVETFIADHSDEFDEAIDVASLTDYQIDKIIAERDDNCSHDDEYFEAFENAIKAVINE